MHQDAGHYAKKHAKDTVLNEKAAQAVKKRTKDSRISCRAAHEAAAEAGVSPEVIGQTLDLLEIRILGCQLGLFGHKSGSPDVNHGKAVFKTTESSEAVRRAVKDDAESEGISCLQLWMAAEAAGCSKISAAAVCEEMDIKIHSCQLGAF